MVQVVEEQAYLPACKPCQEGGKAGGLTDSFSPFLPGKTKAGLTENFCSFIILAAKGLLQSPVSP
jgi:hypothetical protein